MKKKILFEGQPCRKCGTPVKKKSHDGPTRPDQKYWFQYWFECPKCLTLYMVESAKVFINTCGPNQSVLELAERWSEEFLAEEEKGSRAGVMRTTSLLNYVWNKVYQPE